MGGRLSTSQYGRIEMCQINNVAFGVWYMFMYGVYMEFGVLSIREVAIF